MGPIISIETYFLVIFSSKPMFPLFATSRKKCARPRWTIYKHKNKKSLSVGNFKILFICSESVSYTSLCRGLKYLPKRSYIVLDYPNVVGFSIFETLCLGQGLVKRRPDKKDARRRPKTPQVTLQVTPQRSPKDAPKTPQGRPKDAPSFHRDAPKKFHTDARDAWHLRLVKHICQKLSQNLYLIEPHILINMPVITASFMAGPLILLHILDIFIHNN